MTNAVVQAGGWHAQMATVLRAHRDSSVADDVATVRDASVERDFENAVAAFEVLDYVAATGLFEAVIAARHDDAAAHFGLGLCWYKLKNDEDAADNFLMALHFQPQFAEPHYHLALIAQKSGDIPAAIRHIEHALVRRPDYADAHNLLGACLLAVGDPDRAARSFEKAVELSPGNAKFRSNLGYVLARDLGQFEIGASHLEAALQIDRGSSTIWCNYCTVLSRQGRLAEIISICDQLLASKPELHEARLNRALALLKLERFGEAWGDYEARKLTRSNYLPRPFNFRNWGGEPLAGKTVLVYGEQGLGDEIMFASCLPEVIGQAGKCILDCSPRLERLFARSFPTTVVRAAEQADRNIGWLQSPGAIDYQVAAGSLPGFFRRRREDFPATAGYLRADPARVEAWRARLGASGRALNIGIAWRGGMTSTGKNLRSLELGALLPLLKQKNAHFVSLQHDATVAEVASIANNENVLLEHWPEAVADLDEMAALIGALDLVVTVCSATVHLAGALGRRAWVLVPAVAEWRYLESGETMPWYPSIRMFRQQNAGEWQPVIEAVTHALADWKIQ